jgi:hypothetical protein
MHLAGTQALTHDGVVGQGAELVGRGQGSPEIVGDTGVEPTDHAGRKATDRGEGARGEIAQAGETRRTLREKADQTEVSFGLLGSLTGDIESEEAQDELVHGVLPVG